MPSFRAEDNDLRFCGKTSVLAGDGPCELGNALGERDQSAVRTLLQLEWCIE
jgi:hypothetical protein